jgi:hypothetical protein
METLVNERINVINDQHDHGLLSYSEMISQLLDAVEVRNNNNDDEMIKELDLKWNPQKHTKSKKRKRKHNPFYNRSETCEICGVTDELAIDESGIQSCIHCGLVSNDLRIVNASFSEAYHTASLIKLSQPYRRGIYFNERMRQLQGTSRIKIPFVVIKVVGRAIGRKYRISSLTVNDIRKILRDNHYNYMVEHATKILLLFNPRYQDHYMNSDTINFFRVKFMAVVKAFEACKLNMGLDYLYQRKSMLPTNFVLWMICDEFKLHHYKKLWPISKHSDKFIEQQIIYERIKPFIFF